MRRLLLLILCLYGLMAYGQTVTQIEYYFDEDLGFGAGTIVAASAPASEIQQSLSIATSSLTPGFHTLYARVFATGITQADSINGSDIVTETVDLWGMTESRLVFVDESSPLLTVVDSVEIFIDRDPGYGSGFIYDSFSFGAEVTLEELIPTDTLSVGFHTLYVRAKAEGGAWGIPEQRLIFVDQSGVIDSVDQVEFFIDTDPGYGNATSLGSFASNPEVLFSDIISTDTLSIGFHSLYVRPRTSGGEWGIPEQRLIFVDQSGSIDTVVMVEVFIDVDPGYGNAVDFGSFTENPEIQFDDIIPTDTLSTGFHTLFVRPQIAGGVWGIPEQRLIFVDQSGALISDIDELEYFIDEDPGYGAASSIPIGTPTLEVFREFFIATASLTSGVHSLAIRAKDVNGTWGIPESMAFEVYDEGRELDSASLVALYNQLGGTNWTFQTNWLFNTIDTWYGVTVVNGRVDSVNLRNNNLSGQIPFQAGYFSELKKLDLAENILTDTVPDQVIELSNLQEFYLHDNSLNELPDISGITSLNTVSLDSNFFDFGDIETLVGIPNITYSNQQILGEMDSDSVVRIGQAISIEGIEVEGPSNVYQWFLNGDTIPSQDLKDLVINNFAATDTGSYQLKIRNTVITDLTIQSAFYKAILFDFDEDSLALVSLYNSTDGANWTNNSGWLTGDVSTWNGVTLENGRVTGLGLTANNLAGTLPDDFIFADTLINVDLSSNSIQDTIPATFNDFKVLETLNLANNDIVSIPALNQVTSLATLDVSSNQLQFGDLEVNLGIPTFIYSPQDSISTREDLFVDSEADVPLVFTVSGPNNVYQWFKDDEPLAGATSSSLTLENIQFADEGKYRLQITNNLVTGLALSSGEIFVKISSLARDETALLAFYNATGGPDWTAQVNWTTAPIEEWDSIVIANDRVTEVSLQDAGIVGTVPSDIRDITSLVRLNLSGNDIDGIPNMSQMPNLTFFDIRNNKLEMDDIEPNVTITGLEIDPQDSVSYAGFERRIVIEQGADLELSFSVGGLNNEYQWNLQQLDSVDNLPISGATEATYTSDSMIFDQMGSYYLHVSSPVVSAQFPGFELISQRQEVLATADITGIVIGENNLPLPSGLIDALRIGEGAYDSLDQQIEVINGEILIPDLVLGNFIVVTIADNEEVYIPTYVGNIEDWEQATIIELRADYDIAEETGEDYVMVIKPEDPTDGEAQLSMLVESDFAEDGGDGSRIEARRRVKKAGCSLRRRTGGGGGGRTDQEDDYVLFAYKETDDNGEVNFGNLPIGEYRLNIQYPGVPIDPDAFTEFEIREGEERSDISVEATVTEDGISIELVSFITAFQRYFRNLNVYPNPAEDHFMISYERLLSDQVRVKLTDMQGRLMKDIAVEKGHDLQKRVNVEDLNKGVYFLYFYDPAMKEKPLSVFKVIIKK